MQHELINPEKFHLSYFDIQMAFDVSRMHDITQTMYCEKNCLLQIKTGSVNGAHIDVHR